MVLLLASFALCILCGVLIHVMKAQPVHFVSSKFGPILAYLKKCPVAGTTVLPTVS